MARRAIGALLAIVAALAFVVSIASSAWWAGPPTVRGDTIDAKHVSVGLFGARGCNTGGDGSCETLDVGETFGHAGLVAAGLIALATVLAFALAISAWTVGDRRKGLATATLATTILAALGSGAVLGLGPALQAPDVTVPIGWGAFVLAGAVASAIVASSLARGIVPEPLRLKSGPPQPLPLAPPPDTRPLYDPSNAGYVPPPPSPAMPLTPPTPYPRDQVKALVEQYAPTPERVNPLGTDSPGLAANPSTLQGLPPSPTTKPAPFAPPPPRTKPPSAAPLPPPRSRPPSAAPPPRPAAAKSVVPAPARPDTNPFPVPRRARTTPGPGTDPEVPALKPTQLRPSQPELRPSAPTIAHVVPPMPASDNLPAPSVLPAKELGTTVEIDAAAKARAQHESTARGTLDPRIAGPMRRGATDARTGTHEAPVGDITSTGVDVQRAPRSETETPTGVAAVPAAKRIITGEQRMLSTMQRDVARAPTADPFDGREGLFVPPDGPLSDELGIARPASELGAVEAEAPVTDVHEVPQPPDDLVDELGAASGTIGDVTDAHAADVLPARETEQTPIPTVHERAPSQAPLLSTASSSLPPPKNLMMETAPSGPTPACPQCESPMAWVDEHLRFYCKQCRMYF